ncbi:hypothetical protein F5B19DRAFT_90877 [Rostrohypoxylon terebratum]|nr:hypothetical protein F5B19DRAFT_90877 [Rostrohypoxylon terebratum]
MDGSISRRAPSLPSSMPFIISSSHDTVDPATRRLIRSHVMKGKKHKRRGTAGFSPANPIQSTQIELNEVINMYMSLQPGRLGTHLYFVDLPAQMEPSIILKMTQVSAIAMRIIFPLLTEIGFHPEDKVWLYPTGRDPAALHINAFAIESFIDRVLRRQPKDKVNPVATLHHQKGLKILRERLLGNNDDAKISDDTISAVLKLASAAQFDGDGKTAKHHMQGLHRMVDLRGGLDVFQDKPKLLVEILRCDLGIALLTNSHPVFYCHTNEPMPDYPDQVISSFSRRASSEEEAQLCQDLDADLAEIWLITRKFCLITNLGTQTGMRLQPATIYKTMAAVMYRLLHLGFASGSLDETVRLGLLSFTHHIFLQWQDIKLPCHHQFRQIYRTCFQTHPLNTAPPQLLLWLLMIGAVSLFSMLEEPWLRERLHAQIERCHVTTWRRLQEMMKSFMWIPLLDEKVGEEIYKSLTSQASAPVSKDKQGLIQKDKCIISMDVTKLAAKSGVN